MTSEQMIERLGLVISRDEKHVDYERVCEKSTLYRKLMTGEDMDDLMRQFDRREDATAFDQRKRITQHITKTVSQNVKDVYHKIPRSNSVQRVIAYENNDSKKLIEFNGKLQKFWGKASLDDWMNSRWIDLNFLDPNSFIVLEWGDFDNARERATPYPYEVYSKNAIMYEYKDNVLQFLVSQEYKESWAINKAYGGMWNKVKYETFTMYGKNQTVQFVEVIDEAEIKEIKRIFGRTKDLYTADFVYFRPSITKEKFYKIVLFTPHGLGFVPAECVGVLYDVATDGRTFVSPLDKGVPILMKMIKANSEFDLTMALHTFPQKIQYVRPCRAEGCNRGYLPDGSVCASCNGDGVDVIKSSQEMINLTLPKNREDMIDLANIVNYVYPPTDLVKFQKDYIDSLTYQVKESIFNTEIFSRQQVAETATGKNISLQNVYDALYLIAVGYSNDWEFMVNAVAKITDLSDGLIAFYKFSKDFKLKSLTDLYLDLKSVGDAQASEFIKSSIEDDIAGVIYSESERELQKHNVRKSWFPFNGKTPAQIDTIIASNNLIPYETKILWANFSYIFDMIELEQSAVNIDFFYLPRDRQWEIIKAKVDELKANVEKDMPKEPEFEPFVEETTE